MLDAHDLTGTLIFLLSDGSRYVNGQNIVVDDGFVYEYVILKFSRI